MTFGFHSRRLVTAVALLASLVSCIAPSEHRRMIRSYDAEIAALRSEKSDLLAQNDALEDQLARCAGELASANDENVRLREAAAAKPEPQAERPKPNFDDLGRYGIGVSTRGGAAVITIPSNVTFASGSATLSGSGREALAAVGRSLLREYPNGTYSIEGHTDSDPIKKSKSKFDSNRDLSLQRAMAVLHELVDGPAGVPDDRCAVVGWGPHRPVAPNTAAEKAKNRRVEIVVVAR